MANIGIRIIWFLLIGWVAWPTLGDHRAAVYGVNHRRTARCMDARPTSYVTALVSDRGITVNVNSSDAN